MECECGCGWSGFDDVTQYLIEEALYERLEHVDREVRRRAGQLSAESTDLGGGDMVSPGETAAAEHALKMARLGVG